MAKRTQQSLVKFSEMFSSFSRGFRNSWTFGASVGSTPWTPSKALPWGPYSAPRPPASKGSDPRHDIILNPTNFWWWWGGITLNFHKQRGGSTIFLLLPRRGLKIRVFHPVNFFCRVTIVHSLKSFVVEIWAACHAFLLHH